MGTVNLESIPDWNSLWDFDPDAAGLVGSREATPQAHTATRIEPGPQGLEYATEVPLHVYAGEFRDLGDPVAEKLNCSKLRGWLFVCPDRSLVGATIYFSAYPQLRNQFFTTRLKPSSHKTKDAILKRICTELDDVPAPLRSDERLAAALESLPFCPFFDESKKAAAWMLETERAANLVPHSFAEAGEYCLGMSFSTEGEVEHDFPSLLRNDPNIQRQIDRTVDGTIFEFYPSSPQRLGQNALNKRAGLAPIKGPMFRYVTDKAVQVCEDLMQTACRAALSGLGKPDERLFDSKKSKLVAHYAAVLYHRFLYAYVKREGGEPILPKRSIAIDRLSAQQVEPADMAFDFGVHFQAMEEENARRAISIFLSEEAAEEYGLELVVRLLLSYPWPLTPQMRKYLEQLGQEAVLSAKIKAAIELRLSPK